MLFSAGNIFDKPRHKLKTESLEEVLGLSAEVQRRHWCRRTGTRAPRPGSAVRLSTLFFLGAYM